MICAGFITSGASPNAYWRFLAITAGVNSTPALSGSACCVDMRRMPLTVILGRGFCPSVAMTTGFAPQFTGDRRR